MAFFHEYLRANKIVPDPRFDELDEAALVHCLLLARMRHSTADMEIKSGILARMGFYRDLAGAEAQNALFFVAAFLCFFVTKPMRYLEEIETFKQDFIPGFAIDAAKKERLARGLRPDFFDATVPSLITTETLDRFFDITELRAVPGATG